MFITSSRDAQIYNSFLRDYLLRVKTKVNQLTFARSEAIKKGEATQAGQIQSKIEAYRDVFDSLAQLATEVIPTEIVNVARVQEFLKNPNRAQA